MSLLSIFQIVAWSRLGFLARHECSSRCAFELGKWMKNLRTVVQVGKNHKIRDHQVDQSMAKFKSSQTQKTFWSKMNSNISILNKLISKFILNRSNWSRLWSTYKTFECNFEVFFFSKNIYKAQFLTLTVPFRAILKSLFCHAFEEFSILKSLQMDHGQVWKWFLHLFIDLYGV